MIDLLISSWILKMLRLGLSCPHDVPLGAVGTDYSESCILQSVYNWVVDVRSLCNLESKSHIELLEVLLLGCLCLLEWPQIWPILPFNYLQKCVTLSHFLWCGFLLFHLWLCGTASFSCWNTIIFVTVLWIREKDSCRWLRLSQSHWL